MSLAMTSGNNIRFYMACEIPAQACKHEKLFFQGGTATGLAQSNSHWTKTSSFFFACTPNTVTLWHTAQRAPKYMRCDMAWPFESHGEFL